FHGRCPPVRESCRYCCSLYLLDDAQTLELLGEEGAVYVAAIPALCSSDADTSTAPTCHVGGHVSYADVPGGFGAVCPKPLGRATPKEGTSMQSISGTSCALPCPPVRAAPSLLQQHICGNS